VILALKLREGERGKGRNLSSEVEKGRRKWRKERDGVEFLFFIFWILYKYV